MWAVNFEIQYLIITCRDYSLLPHVKSGNFFLIGTWSVMKDLVPLPSCPFIAFLPYFRPFPYRLLDVQMAKLHMHAL